MQNMLNTAEIGRLRMISAKINSDAIVDDSSKFCI